MILKCIDCNEKFDDAEFTAKANFEGFLQVHAEIHEREKRNKRLRSQYFIKGD